MSLCSELFELAVQAAAVALPPPIADTLIADPSPDPVRNAEFGMLSLTDGSAGLYYAWLGPSQADMRARFPDGSLVGHTALDVARHFLGGSDAERSVGVAAINALTEHCYRRAGYAPPLARDSFAGLALEAGDHLGLVGNFPSLIRQAVARGVRVSVLERKAHMLRDDGAVVISLAPSVLATCNKILCTGATLLNDSLDEVLGHCRQAEVIALLGPTVGFFPDPVFARGIDCVAGTRVLDTPGARARLHAGDKLGDCAQRTLIRRADYPGLRALL